MKVLVAYMSQTGNTKKVAEAILSEIKGEKVIQRIEEVGSTDGYDLAFFGFPVMGSGPDKKAVQFLEKHCINGRKVALFVTHASPKEAPEMPTTLDKFRQAARGAEILGVFDCQGQLAKAIKFAMSIMPNAEYRRWAKADTSQGQPDATCLEQARVFSRHITVKLHPDAIHIKESGERDEDRILSCLALR